MSSSLIAPERVTVDLVATDRTELLVTLGTELIKQGIVKDTFPDALLAREAKYPTGLPTQGIKVAIPHCDVAHVNRSAITVVRLANPVTFGEMGTLDRTVDVSLVFVLAIAEQTAQLGTLQSLIGMFTDEELMTQLQNAPTATELYQLIDQRVSPALATS